MKNKVLRRILVMLIIAGVVASIAYSLFGAGYKPRTPMQINVDPTDTMIDAQELEHTADGNLSNAVEESEDEKIVESNQESEDIPEEASEEESSGETNEEEAPVVPEDVEVYEDDSIEGDVASDIDMGLITEENYEMLVFLCVTNGLFDEYEALLSDSFKSSYDSLFDTAPYSELKDVREIDNLFGNFEDKIVTIVANGVSYTFEYTVDSAGLLDGIESK